MYRFHNDYPGFWDDAEIEDRQVNALAEKYLSANCIHLETKWEFRAFFIEDNINELVNVGIKKAQRMINDAWEERCHQYASEVVASGGAALRREWGV